MKFPRLKINLKYTDRVEDFGYEVLHAYRPHALVQAAGYLKHILAKEDNRGVFYRGQNKLYPTLKPSLYRTVSKHNLRIARDRTLQSLLSLLASNPKLMKSVPDYAREPLLQHYGINTRWLDVVDNIWVALWFACQEVHTSGSYSQYLWMEQRPTNLSSSEYAYILLLAPSSAPKANPGLWGNEKSEVIDLRIAAPSQYVRPHMQHGLLVRQLTGAGLTALSFNELVVGIIRVYLSDALEWLGEGRLLKAGSFFPSPVFDVGYRTLLADIPDRSRTLGSIQIVGG